MSSATIVNVKDLTIEEIHNLKVKETVRIESNGNIINDSWIDIPTKLSELFGDFINKLWSKSFYKCFEFNKDNKKYSLWHGNTKWFSLTRLE